MTDVAVKPGAGRLERYFGLSQRGTSAQTEILAGFTTFLTMAYIVLVNPAILGQAGMPIAAVAAATCFAAAFGSILMGLVANTPLALAPGMGLNAYFSFTVVQQMGIPWPIALGCVFISGIAFLILTLTGVRQMIVAAIPMHLFAAVAGGIGLFIGFIGLKNAGIVVANPATFVALGDLKAPGATLALFGLLVIGVLSVWNIRGAMLIGIFATTLVGWLFGLVVVSSEPYSFDRDRLQTRPVGRIRPDRQPRPWPSRNSLRLPLRRPVRQYRHAGRRHQKGGADGQGGAHPRPQPHPHHRCGGHHRGVRGRHQHRHLLC
jgi:AGZA family xanthine/uracil permease-like MFS transporter